MNTIVIKRNKKEEPFDITRIENALSKAFSSCHIDISAQEISELAQEIQLKDKITVEEISDQVEEVLVKHNYYKVAKAYILYRYQHQQSRFIKERIDYMNKYSHSSSNAATASETDSNSNVTVKNVANLEGEVYKTTNRIIQRQRMKDKLKELFPEVAEQYEKDLEHHTIYSHDESTSPSTKFYCQAISSYPLLLEGSGNIDGVTPGPPNDIQSFSGQITNLVFLLSSQCRGAVAIGDYFVSLSYCVNQEFGADWYKDINKVTTSENCLKQHTIKDCIRKGMKQFIYGVNQPAGNRSYNSPFSNIQYCDKYYFKALFEDYYYPDGTKPVWEAIDTLQRIFMELHRELRLIKPLTFPVTTISLLHDGTDVIDKEYKQLCADEWAKGGSFFCYLNDNPSVLSSCCRVQNQITDNVFNSTIGLIGLMTGSCNVITLNLNRIIQDWKLEWKEENKKSLKKYLVDILERIYKYQIAFKTMLYEMEDLGMFSCCNANYIKMSKLYCTIGIIGYCEAAQYLGLKVNNNPEYKEFLEFIFNVIKEENKAHSIYNKKRPFVFNCEAIPGEDLAVKLYNWDKADGYKVPEDQNLYSSYFFLQWDKDISVLDKLKLHGGEVAKACSGGQACHIHLDAHLSSSQYSHIIDFCIKHGVNYFTFNIPVSECKDCGHVVSAPITKCPVCQSENIDWWLRIIGFLRPLSSYSDARKIEAEKRILSKNLE